MIKFKERASMQSLWDEQEAAAYESDLALRVYTSRLLGRDSSLVLHGGGNTSVKLQRKNILGQNEDILYIKGSGWDLVSIEEAGFAPVRMPHLLELVKLDHLSDPQMVNELKTQMILSSAPSPSVETLLHAALPYKYVDHTHADAVVTITNTSNGLERIKQIYGDQVVIIPYVMPGFDLAKLCAKQFALEASKKTIGMILMNHGIFSFGDTAKQSYQRMIELVSLAENYLQQHQAWTIERKTISDQDVSLSLNLAKLRKEISKAAGMPVIVTRNGDSKSLVFAQREDIAQISQQGPATPDHVIRTKRLPMLGQDVDSYVKNYQAYFAKHSPSAREPKTMLDPAPRIIIDPQLGICAVGLGANEAAIAADIYDHTIDIIERSTALGGYQALPVKDLFDMEYWELEQAKLKTSSQVPPLKGEIALVTGAASGIGKACVQSLLKRGAAVVGLDIQPSITHLHKNKNFLGLVCDVTEEMEIKIAIEKAVQSFGGLDMLILNAGIFPPSAKISQITTEQWHKVMSLNLDANLTLLREAHPLLKLAPRFGRVVVIGSKNVPAPGYGAAAYSASKAALNQLARVAALEWGQDNIRINSLHPNAVFDTGIWSEEILQSRAQHYGMSVEAYKTNNLLKVEITSKDVAELAAEMCGTLFAKTTGAQLPIDGGNERVI
jgi:rhamnose utilization protein RhaD (predicted bifunctional aldolase and dehydrogenase)/NAD(P)-dependent dehydrogenase (short-subunit alcohol dehydrogenase family)